jgi:hypothetical protein
MAHRSVPLAAVVTLLIGLFVGGCVSKSKAQAQAREAFLAGQQQALERMQAQASGPTVTFIGEVKNRLIPWTADLTLARALIAADYYGAIDPRAIVVIRNRQQTTYDVKKLLQGDDILLEPRDIVEVRH